MAVNIVQELKNIADDKKNIEAVRDVVKEELFVNDLNDIFTVVPDVKGRRQIAVAQKMRHVISKQTDCSPQFKTFSQKYITQEWDPREIVVNMKVCYKDIEQSFQQWHLASGIAAKDLTNTDYLDFLEYFIKDAVKTDILALALFGNENIDNTILTDPTFEDSYNLIDKGLVPMLQYLKTIPEFAGNFIDIALNAGANYAAQDALTGTYAKDLFFQMIQKGRNVSKKTGQIIASESLFLNYTNMFTTQVLESERQNIINGPTASKVLNKRLVGIESYDDIRNDDFNDGTKIHIPHFALYADKANVQLGVDAESSLSDLTFEYVGGADENFYIKGRMMLDFKIINPLAIKAAF